MLKRRAFTLIELLVVVGIIAVLTAIALPIVNKVRQSTAQIMCLSNLRQITGGALRYAADNGDQLPWCNWGGPGDGGTYQFGWLYTGAAYCSVRYPNINMLGGDHFPANGAMTGVIWPYINSLTPYHCPTADPDFFVNTNYMTSYLCNGAQCDYGQAAGMGATLHRIKTPNLGVYFWETQEQFYEGQKGADVSVIWNDGSSYPFEEVLADRHSKGANVSCFDGHVEWWDQATWQINLSPPYSYSPTGFTRLWCSPYQTGGH